MTWTEAGEELDKGNGVRRPGWGARYIVQQRWTDIGQAFLMNRYFPGFARPANEPVLKAEDQDKDDWEVIKLGAEVPE